MNIFFFFAGLCCPSLIAEQSSSVDISYHDGASIVPVHLAIRHLTPDNLFVSVKVRADRLNVADSEPLTLRYERNIQCFSGSRVISSLADDRGSVGLPWLNGHSNLILLSMHNLVSTIDSIEYNYSFLLDRPDIQKLHFVFSFKETAVISYRRAMKYSTATGLLITLFVTLKNSLRNENPQQIFYCTLLGLAGLLGATPLDALLDVSNSYVYFEAILDELYFTIYRFFTIIQAYCITAKVISASPFVLFSSALLCAVYGFIENTYQNHNHEITKESLPPQGEAPDLGHLLVLAGYAIVLFSILIISLSKMDDRHWNRCGIVVLLLLTPMVLEVVYEVQMPLIGFFQHSSVPQISRSAAFYLGGIVFVIAFHPVPSDPITSV